MRRNLFVVLVLSFCLVGCGKEIITLDDREDVFPPLTLEIIASGEADNLPDPIRQLSGIPIWVYLPEDVVAPSKRYLSAYPNSRTSGFGDIALSSDPNHIRTRWVLEHSGDDPRVRTYDFKSQYSGNDAGSMGLGGVTANGNPRYSVSFDRNLFSGIIFLDDPLFPDRHKITTRGLWSPGITLPGGVVLSGVGYGSNEVRIRDYQEAGYFGQWVISPIETFDLIDIKYDFLPDINSFSAAYKNIYRRPIVNDTDVPVQRTIAIAENVTSESSFSDMNRISVSVNVSASMKVKLPLVGESTLNTSTTFSSDWTYTKGGRESKSRTITVTDVIQVPPRTTILVEIVGVEYKMNITYIATLRGRTTGRELRLTGIWEGVMVQEEKTRYYYPDGRTVRSNAQIQTTEYR
jgi:hypothetical protein